MQIRPFRAYRYNPEVVGDASKCIAPPYDVIDSQQQKKLYEQSEYNIARITKGTAKPGDNDSDNVYTRAADYLNQWIEKGALRQDEKDAIYGYVQNFNIAGTQYQRYSFIAQGRLEQLGKAVRAHEHTMSKPKADRLNLLRATNAVFGLVYMVYDDEAQAAEKVIEKAMDGGALLDFDDAFGVRHRLYSVEKGADTDAIVKMMADKTCIIADGHHRYETALAYAQESGREEAWHQMLAFTNAKQPGMIVLATHRLVNGLSGFDADKLIKLLQDDFELSRYTFDSSESRAEAVKKMNERMKAEYQSQNNAFGIYVGDGAFYVAVLKDQSAMALAAGQASAAWHELDVAVLHKLILEKLLGIDEEKLAAGENIEYIKDDGSGVAESIDKVEMDVSQAAFFMNPPRIEQIEKVAAAGEKMPQKSTFFYPKVYTGLTINKL